MVSAVAGKGELLLEGKLGGSTAAEKGAGLFADKLWALLLQGEGRGATFRQTGGSPVGKGEGQANLVPLQLKEMDYLQGFYCCREGRRATCRRTVG